MSLPNIFKALSDPVRREILLKLKQKRKMSAGEIAAEFDLTNATISYHLSTLKKADLIFETRYQKFPAHFYSTVQNSGHPAGPAAAKGH